MIFSPTCLPPQVNLVKSGEGGRAFWLSYYITIFQDAGHNSDSQRQWRHTCTTTWGARWSWHSEGHLERKFFTSNKTSEFIHDSTACSRWSYQLAWAGSSIHFGKSYHGMKWTAPPTLEVQVHLINFPKVTNQQKSSARKPSQHTYL